MNVNIFCPIFFCCLEHDNSKSPSDFIVIHRIKVNMTFPPPLPRPRTDDGLYRQPGPATWLRSPTRPRSRKTNKMSVFAENRGGAMVISTLVETGRVRVELECSNSRGMSQTAAAQPGTRSSPRQQFSENWKSRAK